jgi:predicted DNA-binding protein
MERKKLLQIKLSDEEFEKFKRLSDGTGLSIASYVRYYILKNMENKN